MNLYLLLSLNVLRIFVCAGVEREVAVDSTSFLHGDVRDEDGDERKGMERGGLLKRN